MASEPIDDTIAWSATQAPRRRDCMRRLTVANDLPEPDQDELLAMIKAVVLKVVANVAGVANLTTVKSVN